MSNHWIRPGTPALVLAPMEGVLDPPLRALAAEIGGFDFAVAEFVRVSSQVIRAKGIARQVPEITGRTPGRVLPRIQVQLLGSDPELMGATAEEACIAGARAIDLNFGCPSPTVVRRRGGAALLREPSKIEAVVCEVRKRLPAAVPVSAKLRLGWAEPGEAPVLARAAEQGGADWLVIHARTKAECYRPGVHWDALSAAARTVRIPVVANGDLFSEAALERCRGETGLQHFMLGRGFLLDPWLARRLSALLGIAQPAATSIGSPTSLAWAFGRFLEIAAVFSAEKGYGLSRLKQWVGQIRATVPERITRELMTTVGRARSSDELLEALSATGFR